MNSTEAFANMFYQEALPKCCFLFLSIACLQLEIYIATMLMGTVSCGVPIFVRGAYKQDVVIVIKIGAYIHGGLFCMGTYYPNLWYLLFNYSCA